MHGLVSIYGICAAAQLKDKGNVKIQGTMCAFFVLARYEVHGGYGRETGTANRDRR